MLHLSRDSRLASRCPVGALGHDSGVFATTWEWRAAGVRIRFDVAHGVTSHLARRVPGMPQATTTPRAAYVSPLSNGWIVDEVVDVLAHDGELAALRSCRAVSPAFHARSSHRLFSTTVVMAGRQLSVLAALLSQPLGVRTLGFFIQVLVIGKLGRRQAHGAANPVKVDPKVLAAVLSKLPQTSLKFEINAVTWTPPFCFPTSPDLSPSRLLLLSPLDATSATGDDTGPITGDTLLSLPVGASWALTGGINNAVANKLPSLTVKTVSFVREGDLGRIAGHLPRRGGVACYGGSLRAWEAFAGVLLPLSTDLKVIAISVPQKWPHPSSRQSPRALPSSHSY